MLQLSPTLTYKHWDFQSELEKEKEDAQDISFLL